ncbi:hypothetical protein B484DRAFT_397946 [Ochromonadaceae sp. CCMP2298]|nr:hypothetical protein B484DRAFT_397946 [Ochromonadaceae sp. CCMP2298]|mmetsp:Transcript_11273/g.24633  ORF Transcript_11273/g.24633 Transcript_11273/m.24633 type:complete len:258 (-) Transcript_11273:2281-3054(-)
MPPKIKPQDQKNAAAADKANKAKAEVDREEEASWAVGAKSGGKAAEAAQKEEDRLRKAADKVALEAADEMSNANVFRGVKTKKKGKDDFDLLNAALSIQPKTKAQKEAEAKKKAHELKKKQEAEATARKEEQQKAEMEYERKAAARGIVLNHTDDLFVPINNKLDEDEFGATGLDAAVDALAGAVKGASLTADEHPERRQKALYNAYFEAQLVVWKEDHPGLKLSQYKDRIFEAWKKAPENPANLPKPVKKERAEKL